MRPSRTLTLVCSAVTVAAIAYAFRPVPASGQHGLPSTEKVVFPQGRDTVSVPFENWGEHLVIPVSVNDARPLQMVFDTGMPVPGVLLYSGERVENMKLSYAPTTVSIGGAGSGASQQARLATGVSLDVGALGVDGSIAIVMPPNPQMANLHDGIIGASLFQGLVLSVDHDKGLMTFTRREAFTPPAGATEVPLEVVGKHAYVKAGVVGADGKVTPVNLIVDVGAMHPVSLNRRANPAVKLPEGTISTRIGRGMSGAVLGQVGRVAGFEIGGHRLSGVIATFPDPAFENPKGLDSRDGNLGSGILGRFNVTFDYVGKRMFLVPNSRYSKPFEWDMTGITFDIQQGGKIEVMGVLPGSPAAAAGVKTGATLVAVDGMQAAPRDLIKERDRFRSDGREVVLTLREQGKDRQVKFKLRRLV